LDRLTKRNEETDEKLWFGRYRPVLFLWSLVFGYAHIGNHISLFSHPNNDIPIQTLAGAIWQSSFAFINALEIYWPLYDKGGILSSVAAHMAWNAITTILPGERYGFVSYLLCYGWKALGPFRTDRKRN